MVAPAMVILNPHKDARRRDPLHFEKVQQQVFKQKAQCAGRRFGQKKRRRSGFPAERALCGPVVEAFLKRQDYLRSRVCRQCGRNPRINGHAPVPAAVSDPGDCVACREGGNLELTFEGGQSGQVVGAEPDPQNRFVRLDDRTQEVSRQIGEGLRAVNHQVIDAGDAVRRGVRNSHGLQTGGHALQTQSQGFQAVRQ